MVGPIPPVLLGILAPVLRARALDVGIAVVGPPPRVEDALVRAAADVVDEKHGRSILVIAVGVEGEAERIAQPADVDLHLAAGFLGASGISVVAFGGTAAEDGTVVRQQRRLSSFEVHRRRLETRHPYNLLDADFFFGPEGLEGGGNNDDDEEEEDDNGGNGAGDDDNGGGGNSGGDDGGGGNDDNNRGRTFSVIEKALRELRRFEQQ